MTVTPVCLFQVRLSTSRAVNGEQVELFSSCSGGAEEQQAGNDAAESFKCSVYIPEAKRGEEASLSSFISLQTARLLYRWHGLTNELINDPGVRSKVFPSLPG